MLKTYINNSQEEKEQSNCPKYEVGLKKESLKKEKNNSSNISSNNTYTSKYSKVKKDGHLILNVEDNYLVNSIESGVVSYIGNKDNLGNTIIVEGEGT